MHSFIEERLRKTPILYPIYLNYIQKKELADWLKKGKPAPPPGVIKQKAIREIANKYGIRILIETGTFLGDMVYAMRPHFDHVYSIELSDIYFNKAKDRFKNAENVTLLHGDSGNELGKLLKHISEPIIFWLDGHYSGGTTAKGEKETPIYEELNHIFEHWQNGSVIIIDDARLFGTDPSYPTIDEISEFIKSSLPEAQIDVQNDGIQVLH